MSIDGGSYEYDSINTNSKKQKEDSYTNLFHFVLSFSSENKRFFQMDWDTNLLR